MMQRRLYIIFLLPALFTACLESPEMTTGIVNGKEKPTVVTAPTARVVPIPNDGSLMFQGEITSKGKAGIIEKGFYWSTTSRDPGINDSIIQSTANTDTFKYELRGASGEKTYYWRAYAKNSFGYDYGEVDSCQTPWIWKARSILPADSRGWGAVFTLNNNIYMTCGLKSWGSGVFATDTWQYTISSDSWSRQGDDVSFPGAARRYPVAFTIGNRAFIGTGTQAYQQAYKDFYQFDTNSNKWMEIAMPDDFQARSNANAFTYNGKGYIVSGLSVIGEILNDVWQYDAANNQWKRMNDFPDDFYGGISISNNDHSFAGFGQTPKSARTLWEYNAESDSFNIFAQLPNDITTQIFSGAIIQNTIYVADKNETIWALNISDKTWEKKSNIPFLNVYGETGNQLLLTTGASNSIYVGLEFSNYLYEYHPLWDN